jgi:hypothetical protein
MTASVWEKGKSPMEMIDELEKKTLKAGRRLAYDGRDAFKANVAKNTPVKTRHLRESYKTTPVQYVLAHHGIESVWCWEAEVFTEVEYAPFVERGTGLWGPKHKKYEIRPKDPNGALAFSGYAKHPDGSVVLDVNHGVVMGKPVVVKYVMHPGSPGAAMFRIGASLTEHEIDRWAARVMGQWRAEVQGR